MKNIFFYEDAKFSNELNYFLQSRKNANTKIKDSVSKILKNVKAKGDPALIEYTKKFDKIEIVHFIGTL